MSNLIIRFQERACRPSQSIHKYGTDRPQPTAKAVTVHVVPVLLLRSVHAVYNWVA